MNEDQARRLVKPFIKGSTITEVQDYGDIFAIHFVNDEYYHSKSILDMAIGAGPTFVEKNSGRITQSGSGRSAAQYVEAYRACGDFFASLGDSVLVCGVSKEVDIPKTILGVKKICGYSTSESKNVVESITRGNQVVLNFSNTAVASEAVLKLASLGLMSKQKWDSQC